MTPGVGEERLLRDLRSQTTALVDRIGLLVRVFGRFKSTSSLEEKLARKQYALGGKLMQDLIGLRVACYFLDDLPIVRDALVARFGSPVGEVKDAPDQATFQPIRWNLVFRIPETMSREIVHFISDRPIDATFEVQLRTVLAEGWHEVEHDLRYKRPGDWTDQPDLSRTLNGILASLENADWAILQLFERLAYQKYKAGQWESMLRVKYRLRFAGELSPAITAVFDNDGELGKKVFRLNRKKVVTSLERIGGDFPLTLSNVAHLANRLAAQNPELGALEPEPVRLALDKALDPVSLDVG